MAQQQRKADYIEQCRAFFRSADQRCNGDGHVSRLELCKELRERGFGVSTEDVVKMFDDIDTNDDDTITEAEFMESLQKKAPEDIEEQRLLAEFDKYDTDGSGCISWDELKTACQAVGVPEEEIQMQLDTNADGRVDRQEFLRMFKERSKC